MDISEQEIILKRMALGNQLQAQRIVAGITYQQVTAAINLSQNTIESIEAGKINYPINIIILYSTFLGLEIF